MALSPDEVERYARHLVLHEVGGPGQNKLKEARVLVVGAGGLGAPLLYYLAAAGIGTIGIIDHEIEVIGIQAKGADAMERSWRSGQLVFPPSVATIADGIGVRVPIAEAVADMQGIVDEVLLVEDSEIIAAMRLLFRTAGLMAEPSGAAGLAAVQAHPARFKGRRVAAVICGSNLTEEQVKAWLG